MIFSHDYLVHYYEIDKKKKLTLPMLIHYFEDIAILNSEKVGFTLDYYDQNNNGFMLLKWDIIIHQWPKFNDLVTINTQPTSFKRFLANREYNIENKNKELIAEAKTLWIFADTKTRKPLRVPDEIYNGFEVTSESEKTFYMLDELEGISVGSYCTKVRIQNSDIDTNDHVNNVRYIEWALESLPAEFINNNSVHRVKVNYKKEMQLGDEADLISGITDERGKIYTSHSVYNNGKDVCHMQFEWIKD